MKAGANAKLGRAVRAELSVIEYYTMDEVLEILRANAVGMDAEGYALEAAIINAIAAALEAEQKGETHDKG